MNKTCGHCKHFSGDFETCDFCEELLFSNTLNKDCSYFVAILCI